MKKLNFIIAGLFFISLLFSYEVIAQNDYYESIKQDFHHGKKGVKLTYQKAGWPKKQSCIGIYPGNPIHRNNMKVLFWNRNTSNAKLRAFYRKAAAKKQKRYWKDITAYHKNK